MNATTSAPHHPRPERPSSPVAGRSSIRRIESRSEKKRWRLSARRWARRSSAVGQGWAEKEVKIRHMSTERTTPPSIARPQTVLVGSYGADLDAPAHSMLGLGALFAEMAEQGVDARALLQDTGVQPAQLDDPESHLSHRQKIQILRNVQRLSRIPDVGLRAGARQRLSDFGVYGYALVSSATLGEAVGLGIRHVGWPAGRSRSACASKATWRSSRAMM